MNKSQRSRFKNPPEHSRLNNRCTIDHLKKYGKNPAQTGQKVEITMSNLVPTFTHPERSSFNFGSRRNFTPILASRRRSCLFGCAGPSNPLLILWRGMCLLSAPVKIHDCNGWQVLSAAWHLFPLAGGVFTGKIGCGAGGVCLAVTWTAAQSSKIATACLGVWVMEVDEGVSRGDNGYLCGGIASTW